MTGISNWWSRDRGKVAEPKPVFDEAVIKAAEEIGIDEDEIKAGGGYRQNSYSSVFWIPLDKLVHFVEKNEEIEKDDEFWAWMDKWVRDEKFGHTSGKTVKYSDYYDGGSYKKKDYLTDWWKGSGYSSWGSTGTSEERRLAVALGAVKTTVDVVNDTGKRYRVAFTDASGSAPNSYTSYDEQLVAVSPSALLDTSTSEGDGIAITTGFALHEASHVQYSEATLEVLKKPSELSPITVASLLHNLAEDLRIEALTSDKYPGFAEYFDKANEYMWDKTKQHAPTKWDGLTLDERLAVIIATAKWPVEYDPITAGATDPKLRPEYEFWRDWGDDYRTERVPLRTTLERGLARLNADPEAKKQMDQRKKDEEAFESAQGVDLSTMSDDEFKAWLEEMKRQLQKPQMNPCPGQGLKVKLTAQQAQQVQQLVQDQLQQFQPEVPERFPDNWGREPKVYVQRPSSNDPSYYDKPKPNLVAKMKSAFFFRKAAPVWSERLLKAGQIDDEELWRVASNPPDMRVFERRVIEEVPDTNVTMLVDLSGSMSGRNCENAQEMATVMLECLRTMKGVTVRVRGHRTEADGCGVFRIWEPGDPIDRLSLISELNSGSNYDGYAIDWCSNELVREAKPGESMVLIVLSDGRPNGMGGYGGEPAEQHIWRVNEHYERKGVTTIQIAIDPAVGPDIQRNMFKNFISFESGDALAGQLTRLLIKLFSRD